MKKLGTNRIETDRLILRKFTIDDAEDMFNNWASDKETTKYVSFDPHKDVEITKKVINIWLNEYKDNGFNWVVELKETGEIIGNISIVSLKEKDDYGEIGYAYGSKYWGNGYATEALKAVIDYLLNECCFNLVEARYVPSNPASGKVMKKAGMKYEGSLRKRIKSKLNDGYEDAIYYSITKED